MATDRVEAFSDGVLAIAITLLILDVHADAEHGHLGRAILDAWPSYLAYLLSFVVIGVMWVNHHVLFTRVAGVDRGLLLVNLALLAVISFLPFPTRELAAHVQDSGSDASAVTVLYTVNCLAIAAGFFVLWEYLRRHPQLLEPGTNADSIARLQRRSIVGPIGYLATIPVAFIAPQACLVIYAALATYFAKGISTTEIVASPESTDVGTT
jgi:uncharacterized membrane protein